MSWQNDIARKQKDLLATESSPLPIDTESEIAELMYAAGAPHLASEIAAAESPDDDALGLDQELANMKTTPPAKRKGQQMRSRKQVMAQKQAEQKKVEDPAPKPEPALEAVAEEETPKQPQQDARDPYAYLATIPGAPNKEQVEAWKKQWGGVYMFPLEDTVVMYRYLQYHEWHKSILTQKSLVENEEALRDAILSRCVLWPKLDPVQMAQQRANLPTLLYEIIMRSSYFIEPGDAMMAVVSL